MNSKITPEDVAKKAVELAQANPEHIYEPPMDEYGNVSGCQYVNRDLAGVPTGEGCLFGRALVELGVNPEDIPENGHVAATLHHLGLTDKFVERDFGYNLTGDPLLVAMVRSQTNQDNREPWGEAIQPLVAHLAGLEVAA